MRFADYGKRMVFAAFDGGEITSDAGVLLLCQTAFNIDPRSACIIDPPERHGGGYPGSQ